MNKFKLSTLTLIITILVGVNGYTASLSDVKSKWFNVDNKETTVVDSAEKSYALVAMVYTGCAHACPMTISKMQNILKDFKANKLENTKAVLASFDVKKDRPEKLKKYTAERKLDFQQWKFLAASSESDARELAVTLGISYKEIGDGDFAHSNVITLISPTGEILASIDNLNASSESLISAYKKSLENGNGK